MQLLNLVLLTQVALLKSVEPQNQCVREIRSLKDDLQNELREIVRNTIRNSSSDDEQELVEEIAAKNEVAKICQVVNLLNVSVATGNDLTMEALSQIVATQELLKNATILNSIAEDQCEMKDEIRMIIREEVESVVRNEVQSIVQRELQSMAEHIVEEIKNNTCNFISTTTSTPDSTEEPTTGTTTTSDPLYMHTCNGTPGWKQVVFIDMTDTSHNCPPGLQLTLCSKRTCGRVHTNLTSCSSTTFSVGGSEYRQVCGRIRGYQQGSTLSFLGYNKYSRLLNDQYVDGVSLTHGPDGRRQHIWTFAAGITEKYVFEEESVCPCDQSTLDSPPFVGDDYFCESGTNRGWTGSGLHGVFFPDDPLWDGQGCSSTSICCQFNNPPWFTKELANSTTDDIELRLCLNNDSPHSDIPLELIELYVQ